MKTKNVRCIYYTLIRNENKKMFFMQVK